MEEEKSLLILSVLLQQVKLNLDHETVKEADRALDHILSSPDLEELFSEDSPGTYRDISDTYIFKKLTKNHLAFLWLCKCHLEYFRCLPELIFHPGPYDFLVKDDLFEILWDKISGVSPSQLAISYVGDTLSFVVRSFETFKKKEAKHAFIALVRNLFGFQQIVLKHTQHILRQSFEFFLNRSKDSAEMWEMSARYDEVL